MRGSAWRLALTSRLGGIETRNFEIVDVGEDSYMLEPGKPWRGISDRTKVDPFLNAVAPKYASLQMKHLYGILLETEWIGETRNGIDCRRYNLEGDSGRAAISAFDLMHIGNTKALEPPIEVALWMDAATGRIVAMDANFSGPVWLVGEQTADWPEGALAHVTTKFELLDVDDEGITVDAPEVPRQDAPYGFLVYESAEQGVSFAYPAHWKLSTQKELAGWANSSVYVQMTDTWTGSSLIAGVEELGGAIGLTLDQYVEEVVEIYRLLQDGPEVESQEAITLSNGQPAAILTVSDPESEGSFRQTQLLTIFGTSGLFWVLTYDEAELSYRDIRVILESIRTGIEIVEQAA